MSTLSLYCIVLYILLLLLLLYKNTYKRALNGIKTQGFQVTITNVSKC